MMKAVYIYFGLGAALIAATLYPGDDNIRSGAISRIDKTKTIDARLKSNHTDLPLTISSGFSIGYFAKDLPGARVIITDGDGNLLVSQTKEGKVVILSDNDKDGVSDRAKVLISGLSSPHGLLLMKADGKMRLYVAETDKVTSYIYDSMKSVVSNKSILASLPSGGRHFTRSLHQLDSGRILISIGSSCDTCIEKDKRRAAILVMNTDGSRLRNYASGLRNSVFMTTRPGTDEIWATEMGRDNLGDDLPPDEVNVIRPNTDYGWPYCYGNKIQDIRFDRTDKAKMACEASMPSAIDLQAHSAPLGLLFAPEKWFERPNLLLAYHGSWNRSIPTGYKIVTYEQDQKGDFRMKDFITGWASEGIIYGRPVGLASDSNGNLYITDDRKGAVYVVKKIGNNR